MPTLYEIITNRANRPAKPTSNPNKRKRVEAVSAQMGIGLHIAKYPPSTCSLASSYVLVYCTVIACWVCGIC